MLCRHRRCCPGELPGRCSRRGASSEQVGWGTGHTLPGMTHPSPVAGCAFVPENLVHAGSYGLLCLIHSPAAGNSSAEQAAAMKSERAQTCFYKVPCSSSSSCRLHLCALCTFTTTVCTAVHGFKRMQRAPPAADIELPHSTPGRTAARKSRQCIPSSRSCALH